MEKLAELVGSRGAEPRGQIQHFEPRHPAGKPVVERVGGTAVYARLPGPVAGADDHVVALVHLRQYGVDASRVRSEEHTSELQSLMRISYAVFCLKKKNERDRKNKLLNIRHYTDTHIQSSSIKKIQ